MRNNTKPHTRPASNGSHRLAGGETAKRPRTKPEYVYVRDIDNYQHYKDRCPWVKLHWSLLDDPAFVGLDEVNRHRFVMCILLASRVGNRILNDQTYLARTMRLSEPVDLTPLIDCGLLLAYRKQTAGNASALCTQVASQRRGESESEESQRRERGEGGSGGTKIVSTNGGGKEIKIRPPGLGHISELLPRAEQELLKRHPHLGQTS